METEHCELLGLSLSFAAVRDLLEVLCESDAGAWSSEIVDLHTTLVNALSKHERGRTGPSDRQATSGR
jgi:hypothetical protein